VAKTAFIFPGQGSQAPGMGKGLYESSALARKVFSLASEALGIDVAGLCFDGDAAELARTQNAQPAILTVSIAALEAAKEGGALSPVDGLGVADPRDAAFCAGHSLGEFTALVAAGALRLEDAVRVVQERGRLMAEAGSLRPGGMAAVLGLPAEEVARVCEAVRGGDVLAPANLNCPGQVVISGDEKAVERAAGPLKEAGAKRVIPLKVSGAFHTKLMAPARDGLADVLSQVELLPAAIPVVANATAAPRSSPEDIRELLLRQLTSPVLWEAGVRFMAGEGVGRFVEFGGKVVSGLVQKTLPEAAVASVVELGDVAALAVR